MDNEQLVTKTDLGTALAATKAELQASLAATKAELQSSISLTKAELQASIVATETKFESALAATEVKFESKLAATRDELRADITASGDRLMDAMRQIETNLLTEFHRYAKGPNAGIHSVEVGENDLKLRLSTLEDRVLALEIRNPPSAL